MNEFTKEELLALYNIIKYGAKLEKDVVKYLSDKLQSMIDNYDETDQELSEIKQEIEDMYE